MKKQIKKHISKNLATAAINTIIFSIIAAPIAFAEDVLIYSRETQESLANTFVLDIDDTGGDITLQFGETLAKQLFWDSANTQFTFTDDIAIQGNSLILDSDNAGAGANVSIIAEQGSDANGEIRYNATTNQWEISNNGGGFVAIPTGAASDADTLDTLDSTQFLRSDTSDSFTSGTLTTNAGTTLDVNGTADLSGATDIIIPNTESNTFILDNDNTGGNVTLQFGATLNESLTWDNANTRFDFSDDLKVQGNVAIDGTDIFLDDNNAGAGANVNIIANQGSDLDGTIRYNATDNRWELSDNGGTFSPIAPLIAQAYQSGTTVFNAATAIDWNGTSASARVIDSIYAHNTLLFPSRITVNKSGLYRVSYNVSWDTSANSRRVAYCAFAVNGTVVTPAIGSSYGYSRNTTDKNESNSASFLYQFTSGQYYTIHCSSVGSAGIITTVPNQSWTTIEYLRP